MVLVAAGGWFGGLGMDANGRGAAAGCNAGACCCCWTGGLCCNAGTEDIGAVLEIGALANNEAIWYIIWVLSYCSGFSMI